MHGIIFAELKKYVDTNLGEGAWKTLLQKADLPGKIYMPIEAYADQEAVALVKTASDMTGIAVDPLLESFGEFIAPDLLKMYASLLKKGWKTLEVLEHTEETIHKVVRARNPGARPPELHVTRPAPGRVVIEYGSPRKMCAVAKGITRGLARHFDEQVMIAESTCMNRGDAVCRISVRR